MILNVNEMLERNMQDVRWKEQAGKTFEKHGPQQSRVIIITCMSPWVDPADIFSLMPGEAYVIRNAGNIVTQDTMRCIMLAMLKDTITDIIVLGHLNCTNADIKAVTARYRALVEKIPQASKYREVLATKDKALKYFMVFQNEIDNVISQVENVRFFKTIQPSLNITGMLYNEENGLVYTFSEIKELKKLMEKEAPQQKVSKIIPKRYKEFLKEQKSQEPSKPSPQRTKPSTTITKVPARSPQKIASKALKPTASGAKVKAEEMPQAQEEPEEVPSEPETSGETSAPAEPSGMEEEQQAKMDLTQKNFEIMQKTIQESMTKIAGVRVFVPKIHPPVIRIPGVKTQKQKKE